MVVDYQCIFPSIPATAGCYHTKVVTTSMKAKIPGTQYMEFSAETALSTAKEIITLAIDNYPNRNPDRVRIPGKPMKVMAGFSEEEIRKALGGTYKPLIDAIVAGQIKGVVGIVGCNHPRIKQDYGHVTLAKELIKRDILVVETGCAAIACGKAGLLLPEAADLAGPGLKAVCNLLGIPPVLHMGSCVDNSRIPGHGLNGCKGTRRRDRRSSTRRGCSGVVFTEGSSNRDLLCCIRCIPRCSGFLPRSSGARM